MLGILDEIKNELSTPEIAHQIFGIVLGLEVPAFSFAIFAENILS
jgi:hypothetical protein